MLTRGESLLETCGGGWVQSFNNLRWHIPQCLSFPPNFHYSCKLSPCLSPALKAANNELIIFCESSFPLILCTLLSHFTRFRTLLSQMATFSGATCRPACSAAGKKRQNEATRRRADFLRSISNLAMDMLFFGAG